MGGSGYFHPQPVASRPNSLRNTWKREQQSDPSTPSSRPLMIMVLFQGELFNSEPVPDRVGIWMIGGIIPLASAGLSM